MIPANKQERAQIFELANQVQALTRDAVKVIFVYYCYTVIHILVTQSVWITSADLQNHAIDRSHMIRNATESDAAALWAVRRAAIEGISTQYYSDAQRSAWVAERTVVSYMQPLREKVVLVTEVQGTVVGYAQLDPQRCEVQALYVHPMHGGQGIGTVLLHALEDRAQSLGIGELHLASSLNAVGFYTKAGYQPESNLLPESESVRMVRVLAAKDITQS